MQRCLVVLVLFITTLVGCATVSGGDDRARLTGALWWVSPQELSQPAALWQEELEYVQLLRMDTICANGLAIGSELPPGAPDPAVVLFEEAERRGMRLFLDTGAVGNWWSLTDPAEEIARARARIATLCERYSKYSSFYGFYIPYELYVMWGPQAELIRALYGEISAACKAAAPDKPVMISPFFILDEGGYLGNFRWATPDEYQAFWTDLLAQTSIDIVALQDSGEHLSCYTFEQRRPFFAAMKAACDASGKTFWANIETGELHVDSIEDYVARFGMKTHVNDPRTRPFWRGVPAEKLIEKLTFVREFTPTAITWGYREYVRPSAGVLASELYLGYWQALNGKGKAPARRQP